MEELQTTRRSVLPTGCCLPFDPTTWKSLVLFNKLHSSKVKRSPVLSRERATEKAAELMMVFAERTGLNSNRPKQRYLWTDAFAVCNFLGLARATGNERHTDLALGLVDQVHHELGRHRADDDRTGWISGLAEDEGERHPTRGGLRIGKKLPERSAGEPFDERLEWDRDGQYFHYLTKWMHALDQAARWTGQARFNIWARELAEAAHAAFAFGSPGSPRRGMVWKMSTDLSRPLVASMGHHDPLDGYITCIELESTASTLSIAGTRSILGAAAADFASMMDRRHLATADPLGLGGLLMDADRVEQLTACGVSAFGDLLESLLGAALQGLAQYLPANDLQEPASRRLAFRELGLSIGLSGVERIEKDVRAARHPTNGSAAVRRELEALMPHVTIARAIGSFWLDPEHQRARTWLEHRDINEVMLATALVPEGFLAIAPAG